MILLSQHVPDFRDVVTAVNTAVLVINVVIVFYVRNWLKPVVQRIERLEIESKSNLSQILDIRENYLRKSRADQEFKSLETKLDVIAEKLDATREQVAALEGFLKGKGKVCT